MKTVLAFVALVLILMVVSTCYYDSEEYLFPQIDNQCDTTNITFSLSVKSILESNCYVCHSNANNSAGANIKLEDYEDVKIMVDNNYLLGALTHTTGYFPMPKNAPQLQDCKINVIRKWIEAGSPNN